MLLDQGFKVFGVGDPVVVTGVEDAVGVLVRRLRAGDGVYLGSVVAIGGVVGVAAAETIFVVETYMLHATPIP